MGCPSHKIAAPIASLIAAELGAESASTAPSLPAIYGLSNFTSANYYVTQNPGGEAGVATGFGSIVLFLAGAAMGGARYLSMRRTAAAGWLHTLTSANQVAFSARDSAGAFRDSPTLTLCPSDLSRLQCTIGISPNGIGAPQLYLNRQQAVAGGQSVTGAYSAAAAAEQMGVDIGGATPALYTLILAIASFQGVPTLAQLNDYFDRVRAAGDLPLTIQGATMTHHWSLPRAYAGIAPPPAKGSPSPATLADNITGAAADVMTKTGGTTVVPIDPGIDGRLTYGVQGFSTTSYLRGAALDGATYWWSWYGILGSASSSSTRVPLSNSGASSGGWNVYTTTTRADLGIEQAQAGGGAPAWTQVAISAADLNRPRLLQGTYDGTTVSLYADGVLLGTNAQSHLVSPDAVLAVGARVGGVASTADEVASCFGVAGGAGVSVPTAAELQQQAANVTASGRIQPIAGKTTALYDLTADVIANGGPARGVPALFRDRIGTNDLVTVGTGLTIAQRVERIWGYETAPILYGGRTFSTTDYWQHPSAMRGIATGFTVGLFWTLDSQTVSSSARVMASSIFNTAGPLYSGWTCYTTGTNTIFTFAASNSAGGLVGAPNATLTAADVGKKFLAIMVYDGAKLRLYLRRAEVGSGTASSTYAAAVNPVRIGADPRAGSETPTFDGNTIHGWFYAGSAWSLAQVQAAHDAVLAADDISAIAGADLLVSLTLDVKGNGGTFPTVAKDRLGSADFTRGGNPALRGDYARAYGW